MNDSDKTKEALDEFYRIRNELEKIRHTEKHDAYYVIGQILACMFLMTVCGFFFSFGFQLFKRVFM